MYIFHDPFFLYLQPTDFGLVASHQRNVTYQQSLSLPRALPMIFFVPAYSLFLHFLCISYGL